MLGWILCKFKGHAYRKARKGEDSALKYCKRCPVSVAVNKRRPNGGELVAAPTTSGEGTT